YCLQNFWYYHIKQKEADRFFRKNPKLEVFYEDLAANLETESRRILDFLGLEFRPLQSDYKKQRKIKKTQVIANFCELRAYIEQSIEKQPFKQTWLEFFDDNNL
ncbi:MAG: sulfotransferase domain-containing protein, partial [Anaerolineales bacterium]|nr:sulfotransferase domain-containing protein [Anaerolineales bacterium]